MWDRTTEEEEPAQNDSISTRVYVTKRSFAISFSMKHISAQSIAKLLDNTPVVTVAPTSSVLGSDRFALTEGDPYYWSILLLGSGVLVPNGVKLPRVIWCPHAYYDGSVEMDTQRISPAMIEVTYRALKHPTLDETAAFTGYTADLTP